MKTLLQSTIFMVLLTAVPSAWSYTNITPAEVHTRLIKGDTLLILDVREVSEYRAGHIAEPDGQLPLTPANLPWNSNVLSAEYFRLPENIDIIVHCRSGGRSVRASSFLESKGFTRIYNMTGGFLSWTFEYREGGFGDHSGQWVYSSDIDPVTITCSATGDTGKIIFPANALPAGTDAAYIELHFASSFVPIPPNIPQSDIEGLFRITALDRFGLSMFVGDSLALSDTVHINLSPKYQGDEIIDPNLAVYVPDEGWRTVFCYFDSSSFHRDEMILRRWYNAKGILSTGVTTVFSHHQHPEVKVFPNPFNSSVQIITPANALIFIYDIRGRLIEQLKFPIWSPDNSVVTGLYFINLQYAGQNIIKRVIYLK